MQFYQKHNHNIDTQLAVDFSKNKWYLDLILFNNVDSSYFTDSFIFKTRII